MYQNLARHTFRRPARLGPDELSTDRFTLNMVMVPDVYSYPINSAYTNAIISIAPNVAANTAVELSHTGDAYAPHHRRPSSNQQKADVTAPVSQGTGTATDNITRT